MSTRERLQTSVMPEELEAILDATNRIAAADDDASELERQAAAVRDEAQEARVAAFSQAAARLTQLIEEGNASLVEIATVAAELRDLDPEIIRLYGQPEADKLIATFTEIQPGAPAIDLPAERAAHYTGVITGEPTNLVLHHREPSRSRHYVQPFSSPWLTFDVPVRGRSSRDPEVKDRVVVGVELGALRQAHIGRGTIQAILDAASFAMSYNLTYGHTTSNRATLHTLRQQAALFTSLGYEPFDTHALDKAWRQAEKHEKAQRKAAARRPSFSDIILR